MLHRSIFSFPELGIFMRQTINWADFCSWKSGDPNKSNNHSTVALLNEIIILIVFISELFCEKKNLPTLNLFSFSLFLRVWTNTLGIWWKSENNKNDNWWVMTDDTYIWFSMGEWATRVGLHKNKHGDRKATKWLRKTKLAFPKKISELLLFPLSIELSHRLSATMFWLAHHVILYVKIVTWVHCLYTNSSYISISQLVQLRDFPLKQKIRNCSNRACFAKSTEITSCIVDKNIDRICFRSQSKLVCTVNRIRCV